jgi:hypothetical protein
MNNLGGGCFDGSDWAVNFHFFWCGGESGGGGFIGSATCRWTDSWNLWFPMKGKRPDVNYGSIRLFCEDKDTLIFEILGDDSTRISLADRRSRDQVLSSKSQMRTGSAY